MPEGSSPGPAARRARWRRLPALALVWLPALIVLMPLTVLFWRAGQPVGGDMWQHVVDNRLGGYLRHTGLLVLLVTALAVMFGVPAAWLVAVHHFPGRKLFEWLLLLPLAMPGFVAAGAYVDLSQSLVPLQIWVRQTYGIDAFLRFQEVLPWGFVVLILSSTLFPYVFLSCRAVFAREAAGPLEAARMLGAGNLRLFWQVALPLARPAVVAGGSLVAMEAINDFGVVTYFGLTPLTLGIFSAWGEGYPEIAMRLSLFLMAFVLIGLSVERWQRGRKRFAADPGDAPLTRRRLGPMGWLWAWLVCGLPLALGFLFPAGKMARWAWQSWDRYDWSATSAAAVNSFSLAAGAALLIVLGAVVLVSGRRAFGLRSLRVAERIGVLGYALPSALVAVCVGAAVSWLSAWPQLAGLALSASAFGLMLAYFIRFLAVGIQPAAAGFARIPAGLHEAARTLGSRPLRALLRVDLPLVWPALLAGATLAFIDVFKELPITKSLSPFEFETLATLAFRLSGEGRVPEASVPGLALVGLSLVGLIPLTLMLRNATRS